MAPGEPPMPAQLGRGLPLLWSGLSLHLVPRLPWWFGRDRGLQWGRAGPGSGLLGSDVGPVGSGGQVQPC